MSVGELREVLQKLKSNEQTRVNSKYADVKRAVLLFSSEDIRQQLVDDEDAWPDAFLCLSDAVSFECEENLERCRQHKKASSYKHDIFHLYKDMVRHQLEVVSTHVDLESLIGGLLACLKRNSAIKSVDAACGETWSTTLSLIVDLLTLYDASDLSFFSLKSLWESCVAHLEDSVKNQDSKSERARMASILASVAAHFHETHFFIKIQEVVKSISDICSKFDWDAKDPTRTFLISLPNFLMENNADRHRDLFIQAFVPLAATLSEKLELMSTNESGHFANLSPMKQDRNRVEVDDVVDYSKTLYTFVENVLILVYPDCELVIGADAAAVVEQASSALFNQLDEKIRRSFNNKKSFVLPPVKVRFLARLLLLRHLLNQRDVDGALSPSAKKRRKSSQLMEFSSNSKYSQLQILEELLIRWQHRLKKGDLNLIARNLAGLDKKALKKDDKLDLYMRLMALLLREKRKLSEITGECPVYRDLWNWGMSLVQLPSTHDSACDFLSCVLPYFTDVLKTKPYYMWRNISFQLAQFSVYGRNTLRLFHTAIQTFEFDERVMFRVDKACSEDWCFRGQLLSSILELSKVDAEEVFELIKAVIVYHPKEVGLKEQRYDGLFHSKFEKLLADNYCAAVKKELVTNKYNVNDDSITFLLDSVVQALIELWEINVEDCGRRFFLWKICLLCCETFTGAEEFRALLEDFEQFFANEFEEEDVDVDYLLRSMDVGRLWKQTTKVLRAKIEEFSNQGSAICSRYTLFWSANVALSISLLEDPVVVESGNLEYLVLGNVDKLSIADFHLLLRRFGAKLDPLTNFQIIEKVLTEIDADYQLSKNAELMRSQKERLFALVCQNVDLNGVEQELFLKLMECSLRPGIEIARVPLHLFTDDMLTELLSKVDQFTYCRLLNVALDGFRDRSIPEPILNSLLSHDPAFVASYVPYLDRLVKFFEPVLAVCVVKGQVAVNKLWRTRLFDAIEKPITKVLLGIECPVDAALSPVVFCLPPGWLVQAYSCEFFDSHWLSWEEAPVAYYHCFQQLRELIYGLRQCKDSRINYPLIILDNLITMASKRQNLEAYPYYSDEVVSLALALINDAMDLCSDVSLAPLMYRFLQLFENGVLSILKVIVVVDILKDNSERFPQTCGILLNIEKSCDENHPSNVLQEYIVYVFSDYLTENEPAFLRDDVNKYSDSYNVIDILEFSAQTRGFWHMMRKYTEDHRDERILRCIMPYWMFFPRLRPLLTEVLVLFPDDIVKPFLKDHRYFIMAFKNYEDFLQLVVEITILLLFDPITIQKPSIVSSLYSLIISGTLKMDSQNETDDLIIDEVSSNNYCALILRNVEQFMKVKNYMRRFFDVANQIPICAGIALLQVIQYLNPVGRDELMKLINQTFERLLLEDDQQMQRRRSTEDSNAPLLSFNFSQTISLGSGVFSAAPVSDRQSLLRSECAMIFLYTVVGILENPLIDINWITLPSCCKCLALAEMYKEAHYFIKYFIDHQPIPKRGNFMFENGSSILDVMDDSELHTLMLNILIGLEDSGGISQLPLTVKTCNEARLFLAEATSDWGKMTSICNNTGNRDKQANALLAFGSLPSDCSREVFYECIVKSSAFDSNTMSYPKDSTSLWEQLAAVIKRYKDDKPYKKWNFLDASMSDISRDSIVDSSKLYHCRHLLIIKDLNQQCATKIPDGILQCSFHLANISKTKNATMTVSRQMFLRASEAVAAQSKELRKSGAHLFSQKLLDAFDDCKSKATEFADVIYETALEKVKTYYGIEGNDMGIFLVKDLMEKKPLTEASSREKIILSRAAKLLGRLQVGMRQEHLKKAVEIAKEASKDLYSKNLLKLGLFLENRYHDSEEFMESTAFKAKKDCVEKINNQEGDVRQRMSSVKDKEERLKIVALEAELKNEKIDVENIQKRRLESLYSTVKRYLEAIITGNMDRSIVYRVTALLIANTKDRGLMEIVTKRLSAIPTIVWLDVITLLSSHLFSNSIIATVVEQIAVKLISEYPYHAVNTFLFYTSNATRKTKVEQIFAKVTKLKPELRVIIDDLIEAHGWFTQIGVANRKDTSLFESHGKDLRLKPKLKLIKNKKMYNRIPIPTITQKVYPAGDKRNLEADSFVTIVAVNDKVQVADGISAPIIINITGSDNKLYRVIIKGEDLRQDLLIQQLFLLANCIMKQNPACRRGFVPLSTYNVVPLNAECGLIEYCRNTMSLCEYLIGPDKASGAHKHYRPSDLSTQDARKWLQEEQKGGDPHAVFMEICEKIQPVFRNFFYERFKTANEFHLAIDRYTQSLAQWSIVGFLVGLGDRHLTNIRIEEHTGCLVHIDFGMVFEFSRRVLQIPEKIPFRLTRDLVDPLLVDGVNGKLRTIAVHTLKHMRENGQVFSGIAKTLLHDPVSAYAAKVQKNNGTLQNDETRHFVAENAIARLKEKLAGRDLSLQVLSPDQHVDKLFKEAMNVDNLSRIFVGWMSFI